VVTPVVGVDGVELKTCGNGGDLRRCFGGHGSKCP
jgi:hypothetical protein